MSERLESCTCRAIKQYVQYEGGFYFVSCWNCGEEGPKSNSRIVAEELWNNHITEKTCKKEEN